MKVYVSKVVRVQRVFKGNKIKSSLEILRLKRQFYNRCRDLALETRLANRVFSDDIMRLNDGVVLKILKIFTTWRRWEYKRMILEWQSAFQENQF